MHILLVSGYDSDLDMNVWALWESNGRDLISRLAWTPFRNRCHTDIVSAVAYQDKKAALDLIKNTPEWTSEWVGVSQT